MADVLEHYDFQEIKTLVDRVIPRPSG